LKRVFPFFALVALFCTRVEVPELISPVGGETLLTSTPEFIWHPAPSARSYAIQISRDSLFAESIDTLVYSDTSFILADTLELGQEYHWRVVTRTAQGAESEPSEPETFYIQKGIQLLTPTESDSTAWPEFSWEPFSGASAYHLLLSRYADFSQPFLDTTLVVTSLELSDSLPPATYFWNVQAREADGFVSSPSPTRRLVSYRLADTYFPLYIGRVQQFRFVHQKGTYNTLSKDTTVLSSTDTIFDLTVSDSFWEGGRLYWTLSDTLWDVGDTLSIHHDSVFSPHRFMGGLYPEDGTVFLSWQDLSFKVVHLDPDIIFYRKSGTFGATDYDSTAIVRSPGLGTVLMIRCTADIPADSLCYWELDSLELD
jgi:hypothetical protein